MLVLDSAISTGLSSSVRTINGKAEHYVSGVLQQTFSKDTSLQKIEIQRVAENSRFFGMVICQRLNIKVRDVSRSISVSSGDTLIPYLGVGNSFINYPTFHITEINRDEKTNQLSITGYDLIDDLKNHTVDELNLTPPYTIAEFLTALVTFAGTTYTVVNVSDMTPFGTNYTEGANFEGNETLRDALQYITEVTQTIAYINNSNQIVLKRLSPNDTAVFSITKSLYTDLSSKTNRRLIGIAHVTELGDNVEAKLEQTGTIQQVKNNPFWDLRTDIGTLVDNALAAVGGLTINQFNCSWIGNIALELGDKINITTKDNNTVSSYVLDDVITFDGGLNEQTQWNYAEEEGVVSNPSSIGELLKQTYARVDKQEKTIDLVASSVSAYSEDISSLQINTSGINALVSSLKTTTESAIADLQGTVQTLSNSVAASMTSEQIHLAIQQAVENSVNQVATETGFTFDKDGLTISKTGSEMTTVINEDGMQVSKSGTGVLTANNEGVNAINLTARQYLTIGTHSRFEDYKYDRTGCFWIS